MTTPSPSPSPAETKCPACLRGDHTRHNGGLGLILGACSNPKCECSWRGETPIVSSPVKPLPVLTEWHLAQEPILKYFKFDHLRDETMKNTSAVFCDAAMRVVESLPRNPERSVALRKLLEAKDAAVRSVIP